jgi:cell fate regulator YaaT (PSP1 superfamily)
MFAHFRHRDRRKLTFYFVADKRIDFRELVRELFRCAFRVSLLVWSITELHM